MANIDDSTFEAVSNSNFKTIGETAAQYSNIILGNLITHQQEMNVISRATTGKIVKNLTELDVEESVGVTKAATGNDMASQLATLAATVAANAQLNKGVQLTPPQA